MDETILKNIDTFFTQYYHQTYKKGEILIRVDESPLGVYYLKEGYVKQYAISKKGEEVVINIFKPIAFFPMSWAINHTPNAYFYEAMTDLSLWRAPRDAVITFIKSNPDVLYGLVSRVYKGVDGVFMRMVHLMSGSGYSRLLLELIIQSKRFGTQSKGAVEITISEKDLAAQSGMTSETISRAMRILKDKHLLTYRKSVLRIPDFKKLEKELAEAL
ncbi:MAG: Crp/Fnr family transcriptional regulator [Candidatus Roizmanbacteria bacterium]|nr:Crp/Fnr family transcriptional regulator [Candidatus Roizmanbacteria bacterium]